jgi:methyl coenzyme M reductase beta subunit
VEARLDGADALSRLHLLQERADLQNELDRSGATDDIAALEKEFIKVAKSYGTRKGVSYSAWRAAGVSAAILQKAGINRAARGTGD